MFTTRATSGPSWRAAPVTISLATASPTFAAASRSAALAMPVPVRRAKALASAGPDAISSGIGALMWLQASQGTCSALEAKWMAKPLAPAKGRPSMTRQ
jgi:hypothetical protein